MSLRSLQEGLAHLYDVPLSTSVDDFVCDAEAVSATVGDEETARGEVLLVRDEEGEDVSVGLYVEPEAVTRLEQLGAEGCVENGFREYCLALEGVSHFVYWMFRAENRESVTQLELELQAEVDKYASGLLAGWGVNAMLERSRTLRVQLFEDAQFLDDPHTEEGARYRDAHRRAAKYTSELERTYVAVQDREGLVRELRRFYRLGLSGKVERTSR